MLSLWQNIPLRFDPIAFSIGFFTVHWYAIFFLSAFFVAWKFLADTVKQGVAVLSQEETFDLALILFLGAFLGGRLGFALFYEPYYFGAHPLSLFLPFDTVSKTWIGISGMSFHGGLIGFVIALGWFSFHGKKDFWRMTDIVSLAAPLGIFFGRLGNFFNGELYGRLTTKPWGMYFLDNTEISFRHPSALYEALLEGIFLFFFLSFFRRRLTFPGGLAALFLMAYAVIRFFLEFFREPDPGVSFFLGVFTRGQTLSLVQFIVGFSIFLWLKRHHRGKILSKA